MEKSLGEFLKQKRLEKKLTQKELAGQLHVTESAVSKWERGVANPDITLLPKISVILGVTEHELITASIDNKGREEKVQAKKWRNLSTAWNLTFCFAYATALLTCFICNLAVSKTLSWFWIVLSAITLAFTFTNLQKFIKKYKLVFIPLSNFLALCLLLGVCCIYTKGDWFWIAALSVLLGLTIIFLPIYIAKYSAFAKIKKVNEFVSIAVDFIVLNVLLLAINAYTIANGNPVFWYVSLALPIVTSIYVALNVILCVRFLKTNKLLKTGVILWLINLFTYGIVPFIKVKDQIVQQELDQVNVFKANLLNWQPNRLLENNIHCIICLVLLTLSLMFISIGLIKHFKKKTNK